MRRNKLLLVVLLALFLVQNSSAKSCWTSVELAKYAFDEFDGKATFSIKDAVSCKPVANAKFYLGNMKFQADENGLVSLPLPPEDMDRQLPIRMERDGYITANESVLVSLGSYWKQQFLMSKELPLKSARFVLSWGKKPRDLDLHLVAKSYHISYRNTKSIPHKVRLDKDTTNGYGAETITVDSLDKHEKYRVLVYNYSNDAAIDNKAEVRVYANNKLDRVVRLEDTTDRCLEVATIVNNHITYDVKPSKLCKKR